MTRVLATLRLAAWTGGLVVAVRILDTLGRGPLSVPLASPEELAAWAERTPPADMAAALLRLAALGACLHLLTVTVLTVLVRTAGLRWLDALVDRVTPELVRRVATSASGLGLVVGGAAAIPPLPRAGAEPGHLVAAARPAGDGTATMVHLPPATATMTRQPGDVAATEAATASVDPRPDRGAADTTGGGPAVATMARVADEVTPPSTREVPATTLPLGDEGRTAGAAPLATDPAPPPLPEVDPGVWVVEQGDSFWSIAEQVVGAEDAASADERATRRYWRRLVDANRAGLVDPGNPDLLLPGQRLVLPAPDT